MSYPEHYKLLAIEDRRDEVQAFLDWLLDDPVDGAPSEGGAASVGATLGHWGFRTHAGLTPRQDSRLVPLMRALPIALFHHGSARARNRGGMREQLLAAYFGIDTQKLSEEKAQMLADIRAVNT